jgi:hypothetical protein
MGASEDCGYLIRNLTERAALLACLNSTDISHLPIAEIENHLKLILLYEEHAVKFRSNIFVVKLNSNEGLTV